jgi:uncharacterized protein (DUF1778 family)
MGKAARIEPAGRPVRERRAKAVDRIDARLPSETKEIIERAAFLSGVTLSDFVVSRAYEAAVSVVNRHEGWVLNREQSKAFVAALLNPPEPNEALKAAAARYKSVVKTSAS